MKSSLDRLVGILGSVQYIFLISLTTVLKRNLVLFLMSWVGVVSSSHTQGLFV